MDEQVLREALLLAHDHHAFGPEDCTPENCSAEEVLREFYTSREGGRRPLDTTHGEKKWRRMIALGSPFDDGHTHALGEPCDRGCYPTHSGETNRG